MEIVVLHVADCPNVTVVLERIAAACGEFPVQISTRLVETDSEAATLGMRGSPTVLIDGHDVGYGGEVGIACQLHLPTVDNLRSAIDARH
ncbi:MAG: thioredoxin family protein [Actinobacteria bacterium]|nr:thioredoxin family protein [Actinomycetota bacterium]